MPILDTLASYINDPSWFPSLARVPVFMLVSDLINYDGVLHFMAFLCSKHLDMFVTMPSFYTPCLVENLHEVLELEKWRAHPIVHIWFVATVKQAP